MLTSCPRPQTPPRRPALLLTAGLALLLAVGVELVPVVGADLVAQQWWASWAATSGGRPVDLGWFGGSPAVSYSLLAPGLLAVLGPPLAGVLGTTVGATATTALLLRAGAVRPRAAGVASAVLWAADQLSGRTTFALGAAVGLLALLAVRGPGGRASRRVTTAVPAVLTGALSPVAAVFLGLAAAAWWLAPPARGSARPTGGAALLLTGAAAPLLGMVVLGAAGGPMTGSTHQMTSAVAAAGVVALLVGREQPLLRVGALLTALALLVCWLVPEPVGSNTTRLVLLFAVPVLVGTVRRRPAVVLASAALVVWLLPPVLPADLAPRHPADRTTPLLRELADRAPVGRVEVVPLADHQDALLGERVPLARGWNRQLDVARNPLFYDGTLAPDTYLAWLRARGVSFVALSTHRPDWAARAEATLVRDGVPGLTPVWSDRHWTLYAVAGSAFVRGPADLVSSDRRAVTVAARGAGTVAVALDWDARLSVSGPACLAPAQDGTVLLHTTGSGSVVLTSAWWPAGHCEDPPGG